METALKNLRWIRRASGLLLALAPLAAAMAQTVTLKASHQFPGGKGDVRDEMVQMIARDVAAANVGLEIKVYPGVDHAFFNDTGARYDQAAASQVYQQVLSWFGTHLT